MPWAQSSTVAVPCSTGTLTGHHTFAGPCGSCLWSTSKTRLSRPRSMHTHTATPRESRRATNGHSQGLTCPTASHSNKTQHTPLQTQDVHCSLQTVTVLPPTLAAVAPAPSKLTLTPLSEVLNPQHPKAISEDSHALHSPTILPGTARLS